MLRKISVIIGSLLIAFIVLAAQGQVKGEEGILLSAMEKELNRSFKNLKKAGESPLYFLQYTVTDIEEINLSASYGAIKTDKKRRNRWLRVDCRVGDFLLDNTRELRGKYGYGESVIEISPPPERIPLTDDETSIRAILWKKTDEEFKKAQERFVKVKSEKETKSEEADPTGDFSHIEPSQYIEEPAQIEIDLALWAKRLPELSAIFKQYPWIYSSRISLSCEAITKHLVNSEGTKIRHGLTFYRIGIYAKTVADDGMELYLYSPFFSYTADGLPTDDEIKAEINTLVKNLNELRTAPYVEPYSGPAILLNKAAAVFFHEIFGHRVEAHRQKLEMEGQTFKEKVGDRVLPDFISVYDDPTINKYKDKDISGYYKFDDEGVKSERVNIVENGILKNFLMCRMPIKGFPKSNGHGRRDHYSEKIVPRQGNLIVESRNQVPYNRLKEMLIEECKKQNKPYGLILEDISGGFTGTSRGYAQVFKVIPLLVKRVSLDGKEEIVRGVDLVGTPLISFSKIIATGDDTDVFNGTCGAESGMVPVSGVSPSILTTEIEVEKKIKEQDKPPILPPPLHDK